VRERIWPGPRQRRRGLWTTLQPTSTASAICRSCAARHAVASDPGARIGAEHPFVGIASTTSPRSWTCSVVMTKQLRCFSAH
jgi:hypothetical protein